MPPRKSDDDLLAEGRIEWAFERASVAPVMLPDGREMTVRIEEMSRVGPSHGATSFPEVLGDLLTFGRSAGELRPDGGAHVLVTRVDGVITALQQHGARHEAAAAGIRLI